MQRENLNNYLLSTYEEEAIYKGTHVRPIQMN